MQLPQKSDGPRIRSFLHLAQSRQVVPDVSACSAQNACDFVPRRSIPCWQFSQNFPLFPPVRTQRFTHPFPLGKKTPPPIGNHTCHLHVEDIGASLHGIVIFIIRCDRPQVDGAWRIIPFSKWLITMVSKSPKWGYSPSKWPKWLINRGY